MKRNLIYLIFAALFIISCAASNTGLVKYAPMSFNPVYEKTKNAIVRVTSCLYINDKKLPFSHGSGFIFDKNGYGLTNFHVIKNAQTIEISFINGDKYDAKIIGKDQNIDLALFKIEGENFPYLEFADSGKLTVGSWVVAIGAPHSLPFSLTEGVISAFRAYVGHSTYDDMVQTSAAINPGNSGGPLLDMSGRVVGINTIKLNLVRASGIGFAISSNLAQSIIPMLKKYGKPLRGFIGARIAETDGKVKIAEIFKDYPAKIAGLRADDIILSVNGQKTTDAKTMYKQIAKILPEKISKITVKRDMETIVLEIIPVRRLDAFEADDAGRKNKSTDKIITFSDLNDSRADAYMACIYPALEAYKSMEDKDNFIALDGTVIPMKDLYAATLPQNFHHYRSEISTAKITASVTAKNAVEIMVRNWYRPSGECIAVVTGEPIAKVNKVDIREVYRTDGTFLGFSIWDEKQRVRVYVNPKVRPREAL